jgi:hypothetical protein
MNSFGGGSGTGGEGKSLADITARLTHREAAARGACKKCGYGVNEKHALQASRLRRLVFLACSHSLVETTVLNLDAAGHLTYQCRNFVPGAKAETKEVFVDVSSTSSEDSSPLSDSESEAGR